MGFIQLCFHLHWSRRTWQLSGDHFTLNEKPKTLVWRTQGMEDLWPGGTGYVVLLDFQKATVESLKVERKPWSDPR